MPDSNTPNTVALPVTHRGNVLPEWIDYNGHMNVAYYVLAFDHATDGLLDALHMDAAYRKESGRSNFVLEMHVTYDREIDQNAPFVITTQVLDADVKRIHLVHEMRHARDGWLAASNELITMHIDLARRRSAAFPTEVQTALDALKRAHAGLPRPPGAGRTIGIRR